MLIHFKECFIKDDLSVLCNVWQALDSLVCRPCKRAKVHMKPFLQIGRHGNACTSLIYNVPWAWGPICIIAWTLHHCTIAVWHHLQWGMNNTGSKLSTGIYFEDANHWVLLAQICTWCGFNFAPHNSGDEGWVAIWRFLHVDVAAVFKRQAIHWLLLRNVSTK